MEKSRQGQIQKAKKAAKGNKKGKIQRKHKIYTKIRFHRPKTLSTPSNPKYPRFVKYITQKDGSSLTVQDTIKFPIATEKDMKKMEDENTMVFIVDNMANKIQIRKAVEKLYSVKVRSVNTLIRADGKKKAYVRLSPENDSLNVANKIGII